jgi:prepilin-type N-terminal cleavage/methylation domain-containing protein
MLRPSHARPRGVTLIEVTIALGILLIGLLGMLKLQFMGMGANHAARAHTIATSVARELAAGLEGVALDSSYLTANGSGATAPAGFGPLATGPSSRVSGAHVYDDSEPIPGTRTDAQLAAERADITFDRRWTVWDYQPGTVEATGVGNGAASKLVAVSVRYAYHQTGPAGQGSGEVVLYLQRGNPGLFLGGVAAYR